MICPDCSSDNLRCIDSRQKEDCLRRRRYACKDCGNRFTTFEMTREIMQKIIDDKSGVNVSEFLELRGNISEINNKILVMAKCINEFLSNTRL